MDLSTTLEEPKKQVVLLYGFSLTEALSLQKKNRDQRIIVFSQTENISFFNETPSCEVYDDPSDETLKRIAWETLFSSLHLAFSPSLTEQQKQKGCQLIERFQHLQRGARAVLSDVRDMGKKIIGNMIRNLPLLAKARAFFPFTQSFQGIPAIICGAGPSLEQTLPFLHQLPQRALILAGGSALNALSHASVHPHFAAALDPDPPSHLFRQQVAVEAPLFYQNRVAHQLLKNCHSTRIWVPDHVSYPLEEWLMRSLGLETPSFEAGWNVATFCLHIAVAMGCNPIVLTGVDLCHVKGKSYAAGVDMPLSSFTPLPLEAGKETKSDFLLAAEWIEEFVASHPATTFLNASRGGLELRGMRQVDPHEIESRLPPAFCDLEGKIYSLLQAENFSLPQEEKIVEVVGRFKENISSCRVLMERMAFLLQKWYPRDPSAKGEFILLEVEGEANPIYTYVLQPLWNIWQWVLGTSLKDEPYPGFAQRMQKLLFFQTVLQELEQELRDAER
jgi:Protein of unknown function DUF115